MVATTDVISLAYRAQHFSMILPSAVGLRLVRLMAKEPGVQDPAVIRNLRRRYAALLETDLRNAKDGLYPKRLLFSLPVAEYAKSLPYLVAEFPRTLRRRRVADYRDLPAHAREYPPYFRRTFHWQTDGYLSERSARIYDIGVEFLFGGTADVMRRQVIPPITRWLEGNGGPDGKRLIDIACGTGRTLAQVARAQPRLKLYGLDLSPYYLQKARDTMREFSDVSLVAENAESTPFASESFDIVTSVYLFHELPKNARRSVLREMLRVLRPGGLLVLEDSAQLSDGPDIAESLDRFPDEFHEPFYRDYLRDDLAGVAEEIGFQVRGETPAFLSKVVTAIKPRG